MDRIYLDEASEAPLLTKARDAMLQWLGRPADPSRVYTEAMEARRAVEEARESVATLLGAAPRDVTFTSSATEALNWLVDATCRQGPKIAVSSMEHSAVYDSAMRAEAEGLADVEVIGANSSGAVDVEGLGELLDAEVPPRSVFVQHANHETGTLQPVEAVAQLCRAREAICVVDAALTAGRIPVRLESTGADVIAVSAHKFGGPPGVGAVVARRGVRFRPMLLGGNQERARRAGPENLAAIAGFGAAAAAVMGDLESEAERQHRVTEDLRRRIAEQIEGVEFLGDPASRLPHVVSMQMRGVQGEPVVLALDQAGFAVHSGSACSNEILEPSRILEAIGVESRENLRISIGRSTPEDFADRFVEVLAKTITGLRGLAG